MPITALPEHVAKRLAGHLNIASPVILVKELLDNAIDAQATSVEVIISPNTVDRIEVRDNGAGIFPDDYDSLGRRGHTSKLKTFEELSLRVNTSLGFRGEALASVNTMAKVCVITKTSSDPVAASLQLHPKTGGVLTHHRASAPVGTTVIVTGLYNETPVREQVIIKEASKSLDSLRELLRSYVMARPQLRLQFKVLKMQRLNWSYAPKPTAGLQEAILQIHGAAVIPQCIEKRSNYNTPASLNDSGQSLFGFEAVIVKPGARAHLLPKGRYFSYVSSSLGTVAQGMCIGDAFICLNITCPPGSYDANIEPSKNEVLFSDEAALINQFEGFCVETYGQLMTKTPHVVRTGDVPEKTPGVELDEISQPDTLAGHDQTANTHSTLGKGRPARETVKTSQPPATNPIASVSAFSTQDVGHGVEDGSSGARVEADERNNKRSRPGTPAPASFITASLFHNREQQLTLDGRRSSPESKLPLSGRGWTGDMSSDLSERTDGPQKRKLQPRRPLPTLNPTFHDGIARHDWAETAPERPPNPWPIARMSKGGPRDDFSGYGEVDQDTDPRLTPEPDILRHYAAAPRDLDLPPNHRFLGSSSDELSSPAIAFRQPCASPQSSPLVLNYQNVPKSQAHDAVRSRRVQPPWTPPSSVQRDQQEWNSSYRTGCQTGPRKASSSLGTPHGQTKLDQFISNRHSPDDDTVAKESSHGNFMGSKDAGTMGRNERRSDNTAFNVSVPRAFEASRGRRRQDQDPRDSALRDVNIPLAVQDQSGAAESDPIRTTIPTGDPRAYLLRHQKSAAAQASNGAPRRGLKRAKSSYLPFESIPDDEGTHSLMSQSSLETRLLRDSTALAARFDEYFDDGSIVSALDMGTGEGRRIEERLDHLLFDWNEQVTGGRTCIESQLTALLKGKGVEAA
ncbi:hypothetical protein PG991_003781 [Apiospora marii]|uniref:DNA mismatch repair protein S5 domain-containing protein n=1 Tax=Apiospora marii TaxID=335849 RepID=A0ABR1S4E9_9PEZI